MQETIFIRCHKTMKMTDVYLDSRKDEWKNVDIPVKMTSDKFRTFSDAAIYLIDFIDIK